MTDTVQTKNKIRVWIVVGVVASALVLDYLLRHSTGQSAGIWVYLNILPLIFALVVSGNAHQPSEIGYFSSLVFQWAVIGYLSPFLFSAVFRRHRRNGNS